MQLFPIFFYRKKGDVMDMKDKDIFTKMAQAWPSAVVARAEIRAFTGGGLTEKSLANFDSLGQGPAGKTKIGRRVVYDKDELVSWLRQRAAR